MIVAETEVEPPRFSRKIAKAAFVQSAVEQEENQASLVSGGHGGWDAQVIAGGLRRPRDSVDGRAGEDR